MPNRILRDWSDSYRFDGLSCEAECLFVRLIMKADDYGNFHADDRIVRSICFPLGSNIKIAEKLSDLEGRGLIKFYSHNGNKYLSIINFNQRLRAHTRKFPDPMTADGGHVADNPPSYDRNPPPEEKRSRREVEGSDETDKPPVPAGKSKSLTDEEWIATLPALYPHMQVDTELRKMDAWLSVRPKKQKTRRFIVNWLNRVETPINQASDEVIHYLPKFA